MPDTEIQEDAKVAEDLGPALDREPDAAPDGSPQPGSRTPRWLWPWVMLLIAIVFLYLARSILGPFIIAGVIAYIFSMVIDQLQERLGWPRILLVTVLYLIVLGVIGVGLYFGAEASYQQTRDLITRGPNIVDAGLQQIIGGKAFRFGGQTFDAHAVSQKITDAVSSYTGAGGDAFRLAREVIARLLDSLLVVIVSFYLLVNGKPMGGFLLKFVPESNRTRVGYVSGRINVVLGAYLRGQLFLILLMATVSFLILQFVFHVPYALPLGIITGFLEILPLVGPAIAATLAAAVTFSSQGAGAAVGVVIAYIILRELEDQVVMPLVVGKIVELHPVATIFAVLAGGAIAGLLGMLLAVPVAAAIKVVLDFLYPTTPTKALAQARPGVRIAEKEAEARGEEKTASART
jgi:predicted PurR-regulated permease PerM